MQKCGFCSMLSGVLRKAMCVSSRRGSSDSYYRELGDQDTLKIGDRSSLMSDDSDDDVEEVNVVVTQAVAEMRYLTEQSICLDRFLTMHKRRKKRLITRALVQVPGLVDDVQLGQVQCILHQSVTWKFNAFILDTVSGGRCLPVLCLHLFHMYGLITHFGLDAVKVWKLLSLIEEGYHSTNPYHNSIHATDVTQAMHCFLQQNQIIDYLEPLEVLASLLAAIAHDIDHPGVNQSFLIATSNHLATLYQNTSVLENHHWRLAISCITESRLLEGFDFRPRLEAQISSLILATDITRQHEYLNQFKTYLDTNTLDMTKCEHRHLVLQIALKCADISNPCRPWEISRQWSLRVCEEFFRQGDYEKKLNLPVTALCDRVTTSIPKIQTGFLKYVVTPLITEWHRFLQSDLSTQMLENLQSNQEKWDTLVAEELAEELQTEISEANILDDDLETCSGTNISDSSELLLPLRRSSLNPPRPAGFKDQLRRFSVPLNVFQDTNSKIKVKGAISISTEMRSKDIAILMDSELSIHSQLGSNSEPDVTEKGLSTEKLLPDSSIATITTPALASKIHTVFKQGRTWRIIRQQTFPPMESTPRTHRPLCRPKYISHDNDINVTGGNGGSMSFTDDSMFSKFDDYQLYDYKSETKRDSASTVGNQLRDNLSAVQLTSTGESLHGRKSMPAEIVACSQKDKTVKELPAAEQMSGFKIPKLIQRTISGKNSGTGRRGSAPAPVDPNDLKSLASSGAIRHSVSDGKRKSPIITCQQWFAKVYGDQEQKYLPRRGSLPVEVITGAKSMSFFVDFI